VSEPEAAIGEEPEPRAHPAISPPVERPAPRSRENALLGWTRAIVLGVRDTARDIVEEGKKGASKAYAEGWQDYEAKTRHRRTHKKR